jgi:hypothetical protein
MFMGRDVINLKDLSMPIPNPKPAEKQSDFMIRCVPMLTPYHKKSQAIAICYDKFQKK